MFVQHITAYFGSAPATSNYAVQDFTITTASTGTQDITNTVLGGATPTLALFLSGSHLASNGSAESPGAQIVFGIASASAQRTGGVASRDNSASTDTARQEILGSVLGHKNPTASANDGDAASSMIANGVRIDYGTAYSFDFKGAVAAFAGGSAGVVSRGLGTGTSALNVNLAITPEIVIMFGVCGAGSNSGAFQFTFGVATNHSGTIVQKCVLFNENNAVAQGAPYMALLTNRLGGEIDGAGAKSYDLTASNFGGYSVEKVAAGCAGLAPRIEGE